MPLYRPKSLHQLLEKVIDDVFEEINIPVPLSSFYRVMIENIMKGFRKNDARYENIMEYSHTHDIDDYISTFKGELAL